MALACAGAVPKLSMTVVAVTPNAKASFHEATSDQQFGGPHWQFRMKAGGTAYVPGMNDEVVERHHSLKVECSRISSYKDAD
jgi:hypothetical protein